MKGLFKIILATIITTGICNQGAFASDVDNANEGITIDSSGDLSDNSEQKQESITLDGMIGPYDPNDPNKADDPDFSGIPDNELEGKIPDNYYTISVTVPTSMHFAVISGWGRGQFYSPKYIIENKATRPIYITVKGLTEEEFNGDDTFDKLHLRTPVHYDEHTEIDLYLSMLNTNTSIKEKVRLSEFNASSKNYPNNYLGEIALKQSAILQFEATDWDVPGVEAPDKYAKNDFSITLEFSLDDPKNPTEPTEPPGSTDSEQPTDSPGSEEQIQP